MTTLPKVLFENSGMLVSSPNRIWVHNDSGDSAKLYLIDTLGNILRSILVENATNTDWEDITQDRKGNVFIGDFGNNNNRRKNLKIYKIPHPDLVTGNTVRAEIIQFHYPQQTAFPPIPSEQKYDAEALIYHQDFLYIFTKDRTVPHIGQTLMYQIPARAGTYPAILLDSFYTKQISFAFEITAAAISPDNQQLALLCSDRVFLFSNFEKNHFFRGVQQTILLPTVTQKEALDFIDNQSLYFSNERSWLGAAQLDRILLR